MERFRNMDVDKENKSSNGNMTYDNRDLVNKLKKLNKTLPLK